MIFASLTLAAAMVPVKPPARPIAYGTIGFNKAIFHVVKADLASGLVQPQTVSRPGLVYSWKLVTARDATVGITGTFFAPRS